MVGVLIPDTNVRAVSKRLSNGPGNESILTVLHRKEVLLPIALARRLLDTSDWRVLRDSFPAVGGQVMGYRVDSKPIGNVLEVFDPSSNKVRVIDCIPTKVVVNGKEVDLTKEQGYVVSVNQVKIDSQSNIVLVDGEPVWQYDIKIEKGRDVFTPAGPDAFVVTPLIRTFGEAHPVSGLPNRYTPGSVIGSVKFDIAQAGIEVFVGFPVFRNRFDNGGIWISGDFYANAGIVVAEIVDTRIRDLGVVV